MVNALPVLTASRLRSEAEWRRAYSVLAFVAHAFVWGGDGPADVTISYTPSRSLSLTWLCVDRSPSDIHSLQASLPAFSTSHCRYVLRRCVMELQTTLFRRAL